MLLSVVLVSGLSLFGVTGRITYPPLNAVAEVGSQAIFNCTSDSTVQNWYLSTTREEFEANTGQFIVFNCVVESGIAIHYDVDQPGGSNSSCNLIVKEATMQQAGVYTCSDIVAGPSAILTVTDRDPSITVMNSSGVVAGDQVTMSYTVRYNTSTASSQTPTIQPVVTWTDSEGQTIPSSNTPGTNSITSSISITAGRQEIQPYTCSISYKINGPTTMFASNTPNGVSAPPPTLTIDVLYAPEIPFISTSDEVPICPGDTVTITCYATANPPPTYSWFGPDSRNYSGAQIAADMSGDYTCTAGNVIHGSTRSETIKTTLIVFGINSNSCEATSKSDTQGDSLSTVAIVLGSLLAVSVAVNIATIIVIIRNRSQTKTGTKARTSNTGQRKEAEQVQTELEEPHMPAVYQELSPKRDQSTIYAQLSQ